jgi:hypothetical protein
VARWQKGCLALAVAGLLMVFTAGPLIAYGIRTQSLIPPPVLLDLGSIWVGDVCRDFQNRVAPVRCPQSYTLTLMLNRKRSYMLLRIPIAGPRSRRF